MGSCGHWDASLSLIKKVSVKKEIENNSEEIEAFIEKNAKHLLITKNLTDLKANDILIAVVITDEDEEEEPIYNNLTKLGLNDVKALDFVKNETYKTLEGFNNTFVSSWNADNEWEVDPEDWEFKIKVQKINEKLKFVDLKKIEQNLYSWDISNPYVLEIEEVLAGCSDYIYCGNDNSGVDNFKVTQKFIDSLSVGDILRLEGNGDGEHC